MLRLQQIDIFEVMWTWGSCNLKSKICNFACSNPARVENSLCFVVALRFSEITANFHFWGHVTFWGSCDIKWKISKICKSACSHPARVVYSLLFALSLTFSEIMANLHFRGHVKSKISVEVSPKNILIRYIWKSWNSYSLQVK